MGTPLRVLIVEDSEEDTLLIVRELKRGGFDPIHERVETAESMKAALSKKTWDLILADYSMPHFSGLEALKLLKASGLDLPFIIVSGSIGEDVAVDAMKAGAHDYLIKNNLTRLVPAIQQELREAEVRRKLKHSEKALQEAEKRYRQVVENATEIIYAVDEKGNFTYGNPAGLKVTGYSLAELRSFNYADLVLPEHRERVMEIYTNQFRQRIPITHVEFPFISKTGKIIWFSQNSSLVIEDEKVVGFHMIARDITERKHAEEALRSSEEKYRTILENIEEGYYEVDIAGNFIFFNDSMCRIYGYPKEELMGMNNRQYTDQENAKKLFQAFNKVYKTGEPTKEFDWEIIRKDGAKRYVETSVSLIKDTSGNGIGFRGIVRDITERKQAEDSLRESVEALRAFLNANPEVSFLMDAKGTVLIANESLFKRFSKSSEEIIGSCLYDLFPEDVAKQRKSHYDEVFRTGKPVHFEDVRMDRNYETFVHPVFDKEGNVAEVAILGFDITERKLAEERLRQAEEKYRNIFENAIEGIFQATVEGRYLSVNPALANIYGYDSPEDLINTITDISHQLYVSPNRRSELIRLLQEKNVVSNFEIQIYRKDGGVSWISTNIRAVHDNNGRFVYYEGSVENITERKRTEEALRASEKRFRELFDEAPVGYHEIDKEGKITRVNRTELDMLGYTAEEMLGRYVYEFIAEEISPQTVKRKLAGTLPIGAPFERTYLRKDGATIPVLLEEILIKDSEGRIVGIRSTIQDISERKRAEEEKATLQDQLRQSQKMEAIGRLAGGVAHDFNNILTVIKGYSQLSLTEMKKEDPLKENIEEIKKAADRAADLTRQLLAFSRRQVMEMKVLDLNDLLRNLDKMLRRVIGEDIGLATILDENLGRVKTDPGQIEQVIMNLAVNARDAMSKGGKLTIETANVDLDQAYARAHVAVKPGPYVMISASDTGVGMPPEIRDRIFEPFFTTKEKGKGTGLGLSTVYGIVKQSGGNIWVYSEPGKGTTFKIYLPRVDEPFEELKEKLVKKELPRGNETILIVEDEEDVLKLAGRILSRQGYHVLEASGGEEALRICKKRKESFHLLLTDVVMPQMSGRQLEEQLSRVCQDFKVLYMSGYTDNAITHHGVLEKGMNYIQKPFAVDSLIRKVREVLDK